MLLLPLLRAGGGVTERHLVDPQKPRGRPDVGRRARRAGESGV